MSITSFNNLAVNNSLTVNGNTILGSDSTSTLIVNSKLTFNTDITITGNIVQSGTSTFSTSLGDTTFNGNVIISGSKKLTTGTALTTINGKTQTNDDICVLLYKSLYVTDSILLKPLRFCNKELFKIFT